MLHVLHEIDTSSYTLLFSELTNLFCQCKNTSRFLQFVVEQYIRYLIYYLTTKGVSETLGGQHNSEGTELFPHKRMYHKK